MLDPSNKRTWKPIVKFFENLADLAEKAIIHAVVPTPEERERFINATDRMVKIVLHKFDKND